MHKAINVLREVKIPLACVRAGNLFVRLVVDSAHLHTTESGLKVRLCGFLLFLKVCMNTS